jgi:hypothetical protein
VNRTPYIDGDTLQDIANAYGCGVPLDRLAAQVGTDEDDLRRRLGLPEWKRLPEQLVLFDQPQRDAVSER